MLTLGVPGECRVRTRLLATESAGSWGLCPPGRLDLCFLGASSHLPVCHLDPFFLEAAVKVFGPFLIGLFVFSLLSIKSSLMFSSVQLLSRVRLFATPWTAARQEHRVRHD